MAKYRQIDWKEKFGEYTDEHHRAAMGDPDDGLKTSNGNNVVQLPLRYALSIPKEVVVSGADPNLKHFTEIFDQERRFRKICETLDKEIEMVV